MIYSSPKKIKHKYGFTLIEIGISITILTVMATIGFPYFRTQLQNLKLSNAAKDLIIDLRYAQQLTVSEQDIFYLKIYPELSQYKIIKESSSQTIKAATLPSNVIFHDIGFSDNKVVFNYYGAVTVSGVIILKHTITDKTFSIEVKPSGYVSYQ